MTRTLAIIVSILALTMMPVFAQDEPELPSDSTTPEESSSPPDDMPAQDPAPVSTSIPLPTTPPSPTATRVTPTPAAQTNEIPCGPIERPLYHHPARVGIYVKGQPETIPQGIGIGRPWQTSVVGSVTNGSCFSWIHTHTPDGILHIEPTIPRTFTLGDFFAVWGEALSATQVSRWAGRVTAYVSAPVARGNDPLSPPSVSQFTKWEGNPADIPLGACQVIQINVGADIPARPYQFSELC